jgi:asparagine synthase (glutamine-hydrolysing)
MVCGILAVIGDYRYPEIPDSIKDRGPDSCGEFIGDGAQLIQTRLQITGEDAMQLPLECDDYVLLFNGEIYNYREINKELKEYDFKYDSDFETILFSFKKWGEDFIKRLDGQYAILIWDKKNKKEYVYTDPFKVRSLYMQSFEGSVVYSSNISSLPLIDFNSTNITGFGNVSSAKIL